MWGVRKDISLALGERPVWGETPLPRNGTHRNHRKKLLVGFATCKVLGLLERDGA